MSHFEPQFPCPVCLGVGRIVVSSREVTGGGVSVGLRRHEGKCPTCDGSGRVGAEQARRMARHRGRRTGR